MRQWLQARLDEHGDYNRAHPSQWLGEEVIRALIGAEVKSLYIQWIDEVLATEQSERQKASTTTLATAVKTGYKDHPFETTKRHFVLARLRRESLAPLGRELTRRVCDR